MLEKEQEKRPTISKVEKDWSKLSFIKLNGGIIIPASSVVMPKGRIFRDGPNN
jgi:hypothetical protein